MLTDEAKAVLRQGTQYRNQCIRLGATSDELLNAGPKEWVAASLRPMHDAGLGQIADNIEANLEEAELLVAPIMGMM